MDEEHPTQAARCANCGYGFSHQPGTAPNPELRGKPCPECGSTQKTYDAGASFVLTLSFFLSGEAIRTFWEKNWWLISLVALLAFISSGIGMYIPGLLGAAVSFLITVIGFVVGAYALTRVRETRRF